MEYPKSKNESSTAAQRAGAMQPKKNKDNKTAPIELIGRYKLYKKMRTYKTREEQEKFLQDVIDSSAKVGSLTKDDVKSILKKSPGERNVDYRNIIGKSTKYGWVLK